MIRSAGDISDETQASQLIANVLRGPVKAGGEVVVQPVEREPAEARPFSDPSVQTSIPQLHLFGLADTQTQSGEAPGIEHPDNPPQEQKVDTTFPSIPLTNPPSLIGDGEIKGSIGPSAVVSTEDIPKQAEESKGPCSKTGATVPPMSVIGQRKLSGQKRGHQREPRALTRQRSLSPASDDSFAGPLPYQVLERRHMQKSKNFQVPLSELGCSQNSCIEGEPSDHLPASSSPPPMYASLPQNRRAEPPSARPFPRGQILVAGTPSDPSQASSDSSLSRSQSQPQDPSQSEQTSQESNILPGGQAQAQYVIREFEPFTQAQKQIGRNIYASDDEDEGVVTQVSSPGYASTEPSSSYARISRASGAATQMATQVIDEATQLAEPVPSEYDTGRLVTYPVESDIPQPPQSPRQSSTDAPRSLLSMINPAKRWRLRGFLPIERDSALVEVPDTQLVEETALDTLSQYAQEYSRLHPSRRGTDTDGDESIRSRSSSPAQRSREEGQPNISRLEVIPDSEASQPPVIAPSSPIPGKAMLPDPTITALVEPEGGDGDDDDEPLVKRALAKRKKKSSLSRDDSAHEMPPPLALPQAPVPNVARGKGDAMKRPTITNKVPSGSWETGIVPSSNPQLDHKTTRPVSKRKAKSSAKSRTTTPTVMVSRPSSPPHNEQATTPAIHAVDMARDSDCETEPADDDRMDVDPQDVLPTTNRKRKRTASSSLARPISRSSTRTTKSATPAARATKRAKSTSVMKSSHEPATRVFALWKKDGHYYPGTVYSVVDLSTSRYTIHFDDGSEDVVEVSKMRSCHLKQGDHVLMISINHRAQVVGDFDCSAKTGVTLKISGEKGDPRSGVDVSDIRVATRSITSQWKDRTLKVDDIVTVVKPKSLKASPTPSKFSATSIGSVKNTRKILANTGLVVTLSPGNDNWSKDKDRLVLSIRGHGGYVIDDWGLVFDMGGSFSLGGKRWVVNVEDVTLTRKDLDRVFLLSDDANRKPKFLMALALGIPCLSINWLERIIDEREDIDWLPHLLPAGYCDQTDTRMSQLVDLEWGNSPVQLQEIMENQAPAKIFSGKNILCLASDFVPLSKNKRTNSETEKTKEAQGMVPRIILCMGASRVEAVADAKHASQPLAEFDYVVVKEGSDMKRLSAKGVNCVHFGWVKDCLVASRMLPRP